MCRETHHDTMTLRAVPISLRDARRWIGQHHRHNLPPRGWLFGVSIEADGERTAVGVLSRPIGRGLQDGTTAEITRCCTDSEVKNAASMVYGRLCRAAAALGYTRVFTCTLEHEDGASLKAAGFVVDAVLDERPEWKVGDQYRYQYDLFGNERRPPGRKVRWRRDLTP